MEKILYNVRTSRNNATTQRKIFAQILNRLREGKHTEDDLPKSKNDALMKVVVQKKLPGYLYKMPMLMNIMRQFIVAQLETNISS